MAGMDNDLNRAELPEVIVQEDTIGSVPELRKTKLLLSVASLLLVILAVILLWSFVPAFKGYFSEVPLEFYYFLIAGFVFAMIDGAIGMS